MNRTLELAFAGLILVAPATALLAAEGLDITRLGPIEAKLVARGGRAPTLSPDGKRLLFAKRPNSDWFDEWWLVGADGKGAKLLFRSARDPVWSPDGNRIALNRYMGKIVIYDLAKGKEFEVFRNEGSRDVNGPWWTGDGKALVFRDAVMADPERNVPYLLDLDDLTPHEIRTEWRQSEGWPGEVDWPEIYGPARDARFRLECRPDAQPFSGNVAYTDGSLAALGDPFGNAFQGLWALSMDGRYATRLHGKAPCLQASIAPGASRVAWATPEGVFVGKLTPRPSPWNSRFALPFGERKGVQTGMHLVVYSKRVNPLNGKIVGAKKDDVRGALLIQAVQDENSLAELVEWTGKPIRPDDVAYFESARVSNVFAQAGSVLELGAPMGQPLGTNALASWGGEDGIAKAAGRTRDARAAQQHAIRGTQLYHAGQLDDALGELSAAYELDSDNAVIRNNLAGVHNAIGMRFYNNGSQAEAAREFQKACDLGAEASCKNAKAAGGHQ